MGPNSEGIVIKSLFDLLTILGWADGPVSVPVVEVVSYIPVCDCPYCRNEKILRQHHGRQYEYVYSDVLQCHVRIGESLKEKT